MEVRRWTESAINCWKRGAVCEGCIYNNFFASQKTCKMKSTIILLVKKFGPPPDEKEKTFIMEDKMLTTCDLKRVMEKASEGLTLDLKLTKDWKFERENWLGGIRYLFTLPNGYEVSVIKNFGSYGARYDKWELCVMKNSEIVKTFLTPKEVKGWLTDAEVEEILEKISKIQEELCQ